jgi:thiosulfate/3-mercaptopyruvate sulfurtransferase
MFYQWSPLVLRIASILVLAALSCSSLAATIVDTAFVTEAIKRGVIIWDVRDDIAYRRGHIASAVNIGDAGQVLRNPNTEDFIETARIEKLLGDAGIDPSREIVVYGTRGHVGAYFALFTLQYFGSKHASVFHDGVDGWRQAGLPLAMTDTRRAPVALRLVPNTAVSVSTAEVIAKMRDTSVQILDVRTRGEFAGNDIRAIRGGHIPGALNIPYEENWIDPETPSKLARRQVVDNTGMSLKPDDALKSLYAKLDPNKETIVYCQSGVRAAETATVLTRLGFRNVKVYDSSWLGYAAKLDAPANNEVFFNVGALNGRIAAMQSKIEALEKELAETKKAGGKN